MKNTEQPDLSFVKKREIGIHREQGCRRECNMPFVLTYLLAEKPSTYLVIMENNKDSATKRSRHNVSKI